MVRSMLLVALAAALAPMFGALLGRVIKVPIVVLEILLGLLIGPALLGWVDDLTVVAPLASFGLAMLFFMAGSEIDFRRINGRPLNRSILGWLISITGGIVVGLLVGPTVPSSLFIGIAWSSTALGTLMPVLLDSGQMHRPFGVAVTAAGAVGEFGPLIAISVFLSTRKPGVATVVLLAFVFIAVAAIMVAARGQHPRIHRLITATLHTSGQFAVGAFAAGVIVQFLLQSASSGDRAVVHSKLDALAFGFLVPIFFINTGLTFDLEALVGDPSALAYLALFLVLLLVLRGLPGTLSAPIGASSKERRALALMAATGLPIIVAVTQIGVENGDLPSGIATALVGAGMLSVLLYPMLATTQLGQGGPADAPPAGELTLDPAGGEG
jgi:Kef-type K+ transport system membrane component KefB